MGGLVRRAFEDRIRFVLRFRNAPDSRGGWCYRAIGEKGGYGIAGV